ncbi:hypothetical protein BDW02DRAFT_528800 [Decorospora gaudefroyi]|uniref:DUF7053 domain-containing protein n=1 Tax=Decorospora gaudefroyi TaxID=184978 RepID=A0A6A5K5A0_9PLEO|nr:hypothetical protein BDW02DRAFT_528800 [Decorospora gaudefroyi]
MFSLNTTATLHHVTPLPRTISPTAAINLLHNHDFLIRLDPEYVSHEALPSSPSSPAAKRYQVTDHMNALPAGLWDTTVKFEAEMTNLEDGISWLIKAPLGLVQRTTWRCLKTEAGEEGQGEGEGWCLVEDVEIEANRILVGTVKGKCEGNWRGAHAKFLKGLEGEAERV